MGGDTMTSYPLVSIERHLYVETKGSLWLFDTGAPTSFGSGSLTLIDEQFQLPSGYLGLSVDKLREYTGVECQGLLG
ncbi:uncharacterized protein METZ01_LOCUS488941, partial [marine metagenome]